MGGDYYDREVTVFIYTYTVYTYGYMSDVRLSLILTYEK